MTSLKSIFISDKNANKIISSSIHNITKAGGPIFDKKDIEFFETFNTIATTVFNHESKKISHKTVTEAIEFLNNRVINEITRYILSKTHPKKPPPEEPEELEEEIPC